LFFISSSLGAFAFFGYEERGKAFAFLISGVILFTIAYFGMFAAFTKTINNFYAIHIYMLFLSTTVVIYFTISLGHHSEKQLTEKNDLLTKANAELDRFVYSASHDLRAPLSSLLGLIEIARKSDNPEENKIFLDMMKERVQKLDQFIHEIIDYSRNSRLDVKKETIKVFELVKEVIEGLKFAEGLEEVYVRYSIDPALEVQSDRSRLKVVLNNLIGNAMKYQDPTKEDQMVSVEAWVENCCIKIKVGDNGIGIADEHKEKIFDMFYRASEKSKGSGLGLYIVKETIQKMQGTIYLESEYGKGTSFILTLPDGNGPVIKKKSVLNFKQRALAV
jgi:signal transduction histidine kinase